MIQAHFKNNKKFPGAMAMSPADLKGYKPKDFYITNKLDGERFIIYGFNGKSFKLNRKGEHIQIETKIPDKEVFDCELYENKWYVIDYLTNLDDPFDLRLKNAKKIYKEKKLDLHFKKFLPATKANLQKLILEQKTLNITEVEGYILTKKKAKVHTGSTNEIIKWKPLNLNTIDFLFRKGNLYILDRKGYIKIGEVQAGTFLDPESIVEMMPEIHGNKIKWIFMRYRTDKDKPNFVTTYTSTLKNIFEFKEIEFYLS